MKRTRQAGWWSAGTGKEALVGYYRILARVNAPFTRLILQGLDPDSCYLVDGKDRFYGDELMNAGLVTSDASAPANWAGELAAGDYSSAVYTLKAVL